MKTIGADKAVIAGLQNTCAILASLSGQYRVDKHQLKGMDVDFLADRIGKWKHSTKKHLNLFIEALVQFGVDPSFQTQAVAGADSVTAILERAQEAVANAFLTFCDLRKAAWDSRADHVTDLYEHVLQEMWHQNVHLTRELNLIEKYGEGDYVLSRLEDGGC